MSHKISHLIMQCCIKEGIKYSSTNPAYTNLEEDAIRIREIYVLLKELESDLLEIADRHSLDNIGRFLKAEISLLDNIDHDLIKIAQQIKANG